VQFDNIGVRKTAFNTEDLIVPPMQPKEVNGEMMMMPIMSQASAEEVFINKT